MNSESKLEKQEIKRIIDEINTILNEAEYTKNNKGKIIEPLVLGILGGSTLGIAAVSNIDPSTEMGVTGLLLGAGIGTGITFLIYHFVDKSDNKMIGYYDYEKKYLNLPREKQLEVLKLTKQLVEYYKKDIEHDKNKRYVERYLELEDSTTRFDNYDNNHPQFELLTQEQIDTIHSRGHITPYEKYKEWESMGYCPASGGSGVWCDKYGNCRDCTVAYAEYGKEWKPIEFKAVNVLDIIKEQRQKKI